MKEARRLFLKYAEWPVLIETKLGHPRPGPHILQRKRLTEKLHKGLFHKLTLLAAPAGFGKTTLMGQWASLNNIPTAWLALDEKDNDTTIFWSYFIHALRKLYPHLGSQPLELLHSSNQPHLEKILTYIINELNSCEQRIAVILDDFHLITNPIILKNFCYLLQYLPPQIHIYISSRNAPSLALASLRAKGELYEIPPHDLMFTLKESEELLNHILKLRLSKNELIAANQQIEGWAAGIEILSSIIKKHGRQSIFIRDFLSNSRYLIDYFTEEVLTQLPKAVRDFIYQTSILKRMNSSLCNFITDNSNSMQILEWLEQHNIFILPLEGEKYWNRYYLFFASTIKEVFKENFPDDFRKLHLKASVWFNNNGFNSEAIYHALEGEHFERAANLIEEEALQCFRSGKLETLAYWICSLPEETLYCNPQLWLYYIWVLIVKGKILKADLSCKELANHINISETPLLRKGTLINIKEEIAIIECCISAFQGRKKAAEQFSKVVKKMHKSGFPLEDMIIFNIGSANLSLLQSIHGMQGKLRAAAHFYNATEPALTKINQPLPSFAVGYAILSEIFYEQNQLERAYQYAHRGLHLCREEINPGIIAPIYFIASKIKAAQGEDSAALELLSILERKIDKKITPHWTSLLQAHRARTAIKNNYDEAVLNWLENCNLSIHDEISMINYYPLTTLVRVLLYKDAPSEGLLLCDRILVLVEEEGSIGQQIETLLLQSLCSRKLGYTNRALRSLGKAISLGASENYYRIFIDEGKTLFHLIKTFKTRQDLLFPASACNQVTEYTEKLYAGFIQEHKAYINRPSNLNVEKIKSLTLREWEVLELLAEGLPNQVIADKLFISVVTVKTHVQNICRKLDVKSRAKAIARINELNLLATNSLERK